MSSVSRSAPSSQRSAPLRVTSDFTASADMVNMRLTSPLGYKLTARSWKVER